MTLADYVQTSHASFLNPCHASFVIAKCYMIRGKAKFNTDIITEARLGDEGSTQVPGLNINPAKNV